MCKGPLVTAELEQGVRPGKRVAGSFPGEDRVALLIWTLKPDSCPPQLHFLSPPSPWLPCLWEVSSQTRD